MSSYSAAEEVGVSHSHDFFLELALLCSRFFAEAVPLGWCLAAVAGAAALPLLYVWWRDHPAYGRNVGPKVFPLLGSLPAILKNKHRILEWTTEEMSRAPFHTIRNVIPPGLAFIDTAHPAVVEHFVKQKFDVYQKGPACHDVFADLLGNGIFNVDGEEWRQQRKVVAHEFSTSSLRELLMERVETELRERLLPILNQARRESSSVDLQDLFIRFSFDNICNLAFGMDPASLDPSLPTIPFEQAFNNAALICFSRFFTPPLVWKFKRAFNIGSERRLRENLKIIDDQAIAVIRARREELEKQQQEFMPDPPRDLLSRYIAGSDCSDAFLRDVVVSFMIAGKDSTPSVLAWFFWLLSRHPEVEAECYKEVAGVVGDHSRLTGDACFNFSHEQLRQMHFLHAALSETLRLYPSAPAGVRCAMRDDVLPDGTLVPKGSSMGFNSYAMGRMRSVWGEDCLEFRPTRWLGSNGEFRPESPYKFAAFHAGPRMCPGREVAFIQMKFIAASLIPRFSFVVQAGYEPEEQISLVMRLKGGLPVSVRVRDHSIMPRA